MKLTCIMCPVGCELTVTKEDGQIKVVGNGCIRGARYGEQEITAPMRMVTSLIKTDKGVASVKTSNLVPKEKIFDVLKALENVHLKSVKAGDIVIENVAGIDGVNVIVTRESIE